MTPKEAIARYVMFKENSSKQYTEDDIRNALAAQEAEIESLEKHYASLVDDSIQYVSLLHQSLEAFETDDWQKKLNTAIAIRKKLHLEN